MLCSWLLKLEPSRAAEQQEGLYVPICLIGVAPPPHLHPFQELAEPEIAGHPFGPQVEAVPAAFVQMQLFSYACVRQLARLLVAGTSR